MKQSIIYIISNIDKAVAFEWIVNCLDKNRFQLSFILLNPTDSHLEGFLKEKGVAVERVCYRSKKDIWRAFYQIYRLLKKNKAQLVHTHLFEASLLGLLAARLAGVSKRIHTRHHGSQHHEYFPRAVFYDKLINFLSTAVVAPSSNVKQILVEREGVDPGKVQVIHHGFELAQFSVVKKERVQALQHLYNPDKRRPVIGVISRYIELKGIQYIIPAYKSLLRLYPNALLLLANANGSYQSHIRTLLADLPPQSFREISFEKDLFSLYKLFDVFVNVTIDHHSEAFGQTYVEALASGVPSIFTLSGVASEFIVHRHNALVVPYQNSEAIYEALVTLLEDEDLRSALISQGKQDVSSRFALSKMIESLEYLYES